MAQTASAAKTAAAQSESPAQASPGFEEDTVKLSAAAQAKLMHRQGQSPALIAATLGTDVKSIDGYLGIQIAAAASAMPAAVQTAPGTSTAPSAPAASGGSEANNPTPVAGKS
jgi:hypothetical protein